MLDKIKNFFNFNNTQNKNDVFFNSEKANSHYNLGNLCFEAGNYKNAENHYLTAIMYNSNYANAYNRLGNLYACKKDYFKSTLCYSKYLLLEPNNKYVERELETIKKNYHNTNNSNQPDLLKPLKKLPGISKFLVGILAILLLPLTLVIGLPVLAAIRDKNVKLERKAFARQMNLPKNYIYIPKTIEVNKNKGTAIAR